MVCCSPLSINVMMVTLFQETAVTASAMLNMASLVPLLPSPQSVSTHFLHSSSQLRYHLLMPLLFHFLSQFSSRLLKPLSMIFLFQFQVPLALILSAGSSPLHLSLWEKTSSFFSPLPPLSSVGNRPLLSLTLHLSRMKLEMDSALKTSQWASIRSFISAQQNKA